MAKGLQPGFESNSSRADTRSGVESVKVEKFLGSVSESAKASPGKDSGAGPMGEETGPMSESESVGEGTGVTSRSGSFREETVRMSGSESVDEVAGTD